MTEDEDVLRVKYYMPEKITRGERNRCSLVAGAAGAAVLNPCRGHVLT